MASPATKESALVQSNRGRTRAKTVDEGEPVFATVSYVDQAAAADDPRAPPCPEQAAAPRII